VVRKKPTIPPQRIPTEAEFYLALDFAGLTGAAATAHLWAAAALLGAGVVLPALHIVEQCMAAMATIGSAVGTTQRVTPDG